MGDFRKKFQQFKEDIEQDVIDKQKEIAKLTMDVLFENSPHIFMSEFARSYYDANFKLTTTNEPTQTFMIMPTFNAAISNFINEHEAKNVESLEKLRDKVHITNAVEHAYQVEIGLGWRSDGYHTFERTMYMIQNRKKV